jgi:hypothetical protein
MNNYKIALIQVWLGPLPDYFKYHLKTCENQSYIDFFIFTDHNIDFELPFNVKVFNITKAEIEDKISVLVNSSIKLLNNKKTCDLKASYGDLFKEYLTEYDYVGCYDIDTLMGDLYNWVSPYLGEYDFISTGGEKYHNRLSGPFLIWKNKQEFNTSYKKSNFIDIINLPEVYCFEEKEFSNFIIGNYSTKIISHSQNLDENTGRVIYDAEWIGGKTYCDGREIMFHHFYNKPTTKLSFRGNSIISERKKVYVTDFYWVTHFTENYEPLLKVLINSIKNFSNRKCILYTINYTSPLAYKLSDQFIVRRLDIELGELNSKGKYDNVLSLKPSILSDVTDFIPDSKFVYVDTDIALTINADSITKYFDQLENFPLINSHTHDLITVRGIVDGEEWSSPLNILGEATGVPIYVYPRRKTNVIVFDKNCKWFFDEQVELFQQYRGTRQGIFALHDEDSANLLLNKYNYTKCLPLVDMEEIPNIDMEKFHNYSYSAASISSNLVLPKHENDVLVFHGFKNPDFENRLKDNYYKTVLAQDDYRLFFERDYNKFWWYKNSNFESKNIKPQVKFEILQNNKIIRSFEEQNIFKYWGIFIGDCDYPPGVYELRITETETGRTLHKDLIEI